MAHSTLSTPRRHAKFGHRAFILRLIAVFKFLKAASLIAAGVGLLKLVHRDLEAVLEDWFLRLGLDPGSHILSRFLERVTHLDPHRIKELGIVSFIYAALFITEGTGLWLLKRWGEWVTVFITGSLIPLEIYESCRRPGPLKILVLLINIAVLWYLIHQIRADEHQS